MKLKLEFSAEIIEDIGDVSPNKVYTEEQNKAIIEHTLREFCGSNAEVIIHSCKLTNVT